MVSPPDTGLVPVRTRRDLLAARLKCIAASQKENDPLRTVAESTVTRRLLTTKGWRDAGTRALTRASADAVPVEE